MSYEFGDVLLIGDSGEYSVISGYENNNTEYYVLLNDKNESEMILIKKIKNSSENEGIEVVKDKDEIREILKNIPSNI